MNKRFAVGSLLTLMVVALAAAFTVVAKSGKVTDAKHIRISISSEYTKDKLSVPVLRADERPFMPVIRIPDNANFADQKKASAIRINPTLAESDLIKIEVALLYGDVSRVVSCDEYKKMKQEVVDTYYAHKGERLSAALKGHGLAPLTFAIQMDEEEGDCCQCNGLYCCPNKGYCLTCGACGSCCR